jgi:hypothetical protein
MQIRLATLYETVLCWLQRFVTRATTAAKKMHKQTETTNCKQTQLMSEITISCDQTQIFGLGPKQRGAITCLNYAAAGSELPDDIFLEEYGSGGIVHSLPIQNTSCRCTTQGLVKVKSSAYVVAI